MRIPTDYAAGYAEARLVDAELARNYIAHTVVGDPVADAFIAEIDKLPVEEANRLITAGMRRNEEILSRGPSFVREFFDPMNTPPDWVDQSDFRPGVRMFHRNSPVVLASMLAGTLVEGFSTNISKAFFITGRLRDQGVRRLKQNNRHMVEIFMPGGLERAGDGWKLSVRIRIVHARIRRLLAESDEWDEEAWGTPISAAHTGFAIVAFSARLLKHMKNLGAVYTDEERAGFMAVWRYTGYLMGIPESILYTKEEDALRIFEIGGMCEPDPDFESIAMANSLIHAGPLLVDMTEPEIRQNFAKYVFRVSRALIGRELSDQLHYPATPLVGVLPWFRMQRRYQRFAARYLKTLSKQNNFTAFTSLLQVSVFDEAGISYRLPDHVYAEESSRW
ncbi:MAG: DUF2236 domain-containing protein [Acidimicrobiia bacterium]|nr:DUF2236 domain-containing protein [Acidimicrobiia bacterium]